MKMVKKIIIKKFIPYEKENRNIVHVVHSFAYYFLRSAITITLKNNPDILN